jgi:hypothetical protein
MNPTPAKLHSIARSIKSLLRKLHRTGALPGDTRKLIRLKSHAEVIRYAESIAKDPHIWKRIKGSVASTQREKSELSQLAKWLVWARPDKLKGISIDKLIKKRTAKRSIASLRQDLQALIKLFHSYAGSP